MPFSMQVILGWIVSGGEAALLLWCLRNSTLFTLRCRLNCGRFKAGQSFWFGSARGWWARCRFLPFLGCAERRDQAFDPFLKMKWNLRSRSGWAVHLDSFSTEGNSLAKQIVRQQVLLYWQKFHGGARGAPLRQTWWARWCHPGPHPGWT